jgi:hypothetical protein
MHAEGERPDMIPGPNWARRYRVSHRRRCARAGCSAPAAATLRFPSTQREAWLRDIDPDASRSQGDLCSRHADAVRLPRGWQLHDERNTVREPATAQPVAQLAQILDARTPLLRRAFANVMPPAEDATRRIV